MPSPARVPRALRRFRGEAQIAVAIGLMNVAAYGYTILAARLLGPQAYGAFAGLMATLLILGVFQLGLQATAARRISADPQHVAQIEQVVLTVTYRAALLLGLGTLLISPLLSVVLRLDDLATAALVAAAVVPLTVMGGQAGILQGERRWTALSAVYLAAGIPRLVIGGALVAWRPTETVAMFAVAVAAVAPCVVGWALLRRPRPEGRNSDAHLARPTAFEAVRNSQALLAFFALSNVDVVVARNVLDEYEAGLYAGGLIMAKAVLFLPQFVVVVAFPSLSTEAERRRALLRGLSMVAGIGAAATVATLLLSPVALLFVGGAQYAPIEGRLAMFAVLGTLLAMLQLLVYSVVARQGRRSVYFVWGALVLVAGLGSLTSSVTALLLVVCTVDAMLLAVLLATTLRAADADSPVGRA